MADRSSPRILICRLSALGDCILTLPLACALRRRYPQAFIGWVAQESNAPILYGHPALDHVTAAPRNWLKSFRGRKNLQAKLQALKYDIALDAQSLAKSSIAAWLSGARRRIGFARPQGRELAPWLSTELVSTREQHIVDRHLDLLKPLGIGNPAVEFGLPENAAARRRVDQVITESHLGCGFVVLNVGAGWRSKVWPASYYGQLARRIGEQHGLPSVVVSGGADEQHAAARVVSESGGHALPAPPLSLTELAALLRSSRLFVGSDTGPMHLAAAVGATCVALHGPTDPKRCGPYGGRHRVVQSDQANGSRPRVRSHDDSAMRAIEIDHVFAACCSALPASTKTGARQNAA